MKVNGGTKSTQYEEGLMLMSPGSPFHLTPLSARSTAVLPNAMPDLISKFSIGTCTLITFIIIFDSLEKTLMLGKTEGKTRRGQQRMRGLDRIIDSVDMQMNKFWEIGKDRGV